MDVDPTVKKSQLPIRRVPVAMKQPLKDELDRLATMGTIERVDHPTDWMSHLVTVRKPNGSLRLCLDPQPLNRALKRCHFPIPTLDDVLPEITQARVYSVADVRNGFWHCELDEESKDLTTFGTPFGRYRWARMPFGISPAPEIFQIKLQAAISGLPGVFPIADDILIVGEGATDGAAEEDHDRKLRQFLDRCREKCIKLNKEKFRLRLSDVSYMGHLLTKEGLRPDPQKIAAITKMPPPQDVAGVRRLLGLVNYLARFVPNLADLCEPIRQLTHKLNEWQWSHVQDNAFTTLKEAITRVPVLQFFNTTKEVTVQCDASDTGLGAALLQEGQPVEFASRALTPTERQYAQIEKELLAVVFAFERFHHYTYGRSVTVESDHKPLESISRKPLDSAPRRLQRMLLRLQKYRINIVYKKGREMHIADALSRAYLSDAAQPEEQCEVMQFHQELEEVEMIRTLPISQETIQEVRHHTLSDPTIQQLQRTIFQGWPDNKIDLPECVKPYFQIRDELTVQNGFVFRGNRLVIPSPLRAATLVKLHRSHCGVHACQRRARDSLYWPSMNAQVKDFVSQCAVCRSMDNKQQKETLQSHQVPNRPWAKVAADLFVWNEKQYMVTVDYYSNFAEVDCLPKTTSGSIIKALKQHFARHGIPDTLITDNGPQFVSKKFRTFSKTWQFTHQTSSPNYPQSNGKAENTVRTVKRLFKKALKSGNDPMLALLDFRNTPSEMLNSSPAQRLFSRRTKGLIPITVELLQPELQHNVGDQLAATKAKQAAAYNRNARDLPPLTKGSTVRMQPFKAHKDWGKATVTKVLPNRSYEVKTETGGEYRRNRRHLRMTKEPTPTGIPEISESESAPPCTMSSPKIQGSSKSTATNPKPVEKPVEKHTCNAGAPPHPPIKTTRNGRPVKPPAYLQDYIQ